MLFGILCVAFAAHYIQGASQCPRTHSNPSRHCADECSVSMGCRNSRKKCLCDGDCGYSCVYPRMRCTKPRKIRNGWVKYTSRRFNGTLEVVCDQGFRLFGSAMRTCRGNGYWDGRQTRCRRPQKNCKDPGKTGLLLRAEEGRKSFKPGTKLHYYCPNKFTLKGSSRLVCKNDGTWTASLPECLVPTCRPAVLPPHTKVRSPKNWKNQRDFGVFFSLACEYGYTSTQPGMLECDPPGWILRPSTFKCLPKSCPHPGRPRNGNIKGLFLFNQKVYYSCDECYKLKGPGYRQCQANQRWTDTQPTCEPVRCSRLQNPTHGYLTSNSQECGSIVQYHCDHGYQLNGAYRRRCQGNGTWTGGEPVCEVKSCQDPGTPLGGSKKGSLQAGQSLQFSCDQCHKLTGDRIRTCQDDLSWSGRQPTCTAITCSLLQSPKNGYLTSNSRKCGSVVKYGCHNGYQLKGARRRQCQSDGTWTGKEPVCQTCKDPGAPAGGSRRGSLRVGQKLQFSCSHCYVLTGDRSRTCKSDLTWSGRQPICKRIKCAWLRQPANGYLTSNSQHCGSTVQYHCNDGYQLKGTRSRRCQNNGMWTEEEPVCEIKACKDPGTPAAGSRRGSLQVGQTLQFSCDHCYQLTGNRSRTCQNDLKWSGRQPSCTRVRCSALQVPTNGKITLYSTNCEETTEFTCNKGYQLAGPGIITCLSNGIWSAKRPACISAKAVKNNPTKIFPDRQSLQIQSNTPAMTPIPTFAQRPTTNTVVEPSCGWPRLSDKARIIGAQGNVWIIGCKEKYTMLNYGHWQCIDGRWRTLTNEKCLAKTCSDPGIPKNGYRHGLSYFIDDEVRFTCKECYHLVGISKQTCLKNGSWSYSLPECKVNTCPVLQDTENVTVSHFSQTCGSIATYSCKDSTQTMLGSRDRKCNKYGEWEGEEPYCASATCPPLQETQHTSVSYRSRTYGSIATYRCKDSKLNMLGPSKIKCGVNGVWEGAEPKCIGTNPNIAFQKPAFMSSHWTRFGGPASKAVDGNRHGRFLHTHYEYGPWVKIDLLKEETVSTVIVEARRDCCASRINGFIVSVGNNGKEAARNTKCGSQRIAKLGANIIHCPKPLRGRYVFFYLPKKTHTIVAVYEIEVYRRKKTE